MATQQPEFNYVDGIHNTPNMTTVVPDSRGSGAVAFSESSTLTDNLPISPNPRVLTGTIAPSFYDVFYEKIHFIPEKLELGNVASVQQRSMKVWNAFRETKNLSAFTAINAAGLDISEPEFPPYDMAPLELLDYQVSVTLDGDATINAIMRWAIDSVVYDVLVSGSRVSPFFYLQNWKFSYKETWTYLTSIIRRKNSTEQRARMRVTPRKTLTMNSLVTKENYQELNNLLFGWHNQAFAVPVWPDSSYSPLAIAQGENVVTLADDNLNFYPEALVAIYSDINTFEMIEIESINGAELTFTNGTANAWPENTSVVLMHIARLSNRQQSEQYTDNVSTITPTFRCDPVLTKTARDGVAAPLTYNSKELWVTKANWSKNRRNLSQAYLDEIDSRTGNNRAFPLMDFSPQIKAYNYTLISSLDIALFKEFIERRAGKAIPCYIPTFDSDFTVTSLIGDQDTVIDVKDNHYRNFVEAHGARNNLYLELYDGTYFTAKIQSTTDNGDGTQRLSLDQSFGVEISVSEIKLVSILTYARLVSDVITFNYLTADKCEVTITFESIKEWT